MVKLIDLINKNNYNSIRVYKHNLPDAIKDKLIDPKLPVIEGIIYDVGTFVIVKGKNVKLFRRKV